MNKIILSGNLCRDIEVYKYNNKSCVHNSIAVKRDYKNKEGNYDTDFFNITLWEAQADFINKYASKGTKILVSGRLINNEYEAEDGTKKTSNDIQVESIEILGTKKDTQESATSEEAIFDEKPQEKIPSIDDLLD